MQFVTLVKHSQARQSIKVWGSSEARKQSVLGAFKPEQLPDALLPQDVLRTRYGSVQRERLYLLQRDAVCDGRIRQYLDAELASRTG